MLGVAPLPSDEQMLVAPVQSEMWVQNLPTPFSLPTSPGWPQDESGPTVMSVLPPPVVPPVLLVVLPVVAVVGLMVVAGQPSADNGIPSKCLVPPISTLAKPPGPARW